MKDWILPGLVVLTIALPAHAGTCAGFEALEAFAETGVPPEGATCSVFLSEGGATGTSCHWAYGFRDPDAQDHAAALWAELATCRVGHALAPDTLVNHPDSYDLREWEAGGETYRVSVKDKGGRQETLVFLRYR